MKVFLTGATGFIGSHVARLLVDDGHEVYALIRETSTNLRRISDIMPSLRVVQGDLFQPSNLDAQLERIRPDLCIHLAWYAVPGEYLGAQENISLLAASIHLASRLAKLSCKKYLAAGTCFEYDTNLGYLSEDSSTKPSSLYAASKLALYQVVEQLSHTSSFKFAWLRLFYQYGPSESERRLIPSVILSLLRGDEARVTAGEQIRDYLHVEDVASAVYAVAKSDIDGVVNIGSGIPVSVRDIVTMIGDICGRHELISLGTVPHSVSDPMFVCANNTKLLKGTSWVPRFDLRAGLRQTVAWWKTRVTGASDAGANIK